MISYRRIATASLTDAINDPTDRNIMAMSTLIASDQFMHETSWDGSTIGDIQIFRNLACGPNGNRMPTDEKGPNGKPLLDADGKPLMKPDEWVWWGGVPRGKIKSYRFVPDQHLVPNTLDEGLPFELPKKPKNAQRQEKPEQAGEGGSSAP